MAQAFVIADPHGHPPGKARGQVAHRRFHPRIARAKHDQPAAPQHEIGDDGGQKVDALLVGQAADDDGQRTGDIQPEFLAQACPCGDLSGQGFRPERRFFRPRVPDGRVDPVQDARHHRPPRGQHALQTHAELGSHQFGGIGRRHGGDPVRRHQPALQRRDSTVIFQCVRVERMTGQPQDPQHVTGCPALKGDVVDGQNRLAAAVAVIGKIRRGQPRLPVMRMQDIGFPVRQPFAGDPGGDPGQGRKPDGIVGMFALQRRIRPTVAVKEVRRVQKQHRHARDGPRQHPPRPAPQVALFPDHRPACRLRLQRAVARQQHPHVPACDGQRRRQRAHDVGQPSGLDQRHAFRRHRQNPTAHLPCLSETSRPEVTSPPGKVQTFSPRPWPARPACPA